MQKNNSNSPIADAVDAVESAYQEFQETLHALEEEQQRVIKTTRDELTQKKIAKIRQDILDS